MIKKIESALATIREKKPLILCFTNFVTMEFVANALLALGAAPIMSLCEDELEELIKISSAIYINIGTLNAEFISLSQKAIVIAKLYKIPIVFDPVGAGATHIRTDTAQFIAKHSHIIRGNSSEIIALLDSKNHTHGVEARHEVADAKSTAIKLSKDLNATVIVSGAIDFISQGMHSHLVPFGSSLMQQVTGMGCSMTAVVAAFASVAEENHFEAATAAAHYFAICGEIAATKCNAPGTFKSLFLDELSKADFQLIQEIYDKRK